MAKIFSKSLLLLLFAVSICCIIYPVSLWIVGQLLFPFQANGSIVKGADGKLVGSHLIAQPFTNEAYFFPRQSAASYDASASASSALAASNYALRDRVARTLGPVVCYQSGAKAGQKVGTDIEVWFQQDQFQKVAGIVAQWATLHNSLAQAWVNASPARSSYIDNWGKENPNLIKEFISENASITQPKPADLAVFFFQHFAKDHPGKFLTEASHTTSAGKTETGVEITNSGSDVQSIFFDMWRQDHPDIALQDVPGDFVTTSASGLDPHITLQNAEYQLERVSTKWATLLKRDQTSIKNEIAKLLQERVSAPLMGLAGERFINVLEINLELKSRYGAP
jgi:potassium-transporting ATPase KdpC subunit